MRLSVTKAEIKALAKSLLPDRPAMQATAKFLHEQVMQRFDTQGSSGGIRWPQTRRNELGLASRPIFRGRNGTLARSFFIRANDREAVCESSAKFAHVHQLGTRGKGGILPTIRPRVKKVLYWPITERARSGWRPTLNKGRIVNGQLVPKRADYLLIPKADIAPRGMLPDSEREITAAIEFFAAQLVGQGSELASLLSRFTGMAAA